MHLYPHEFKNSMNYNIVDSKLNLLGSLMLEHWLTMGCYRPDTGKSGMRITQIGKTDKLSREAPVITCLLRSALPRSAPLNVCLLLMEQIPNINTKFRSPGKLMPWSKFLYKQNLRYFKSTTDIMCGILFVYMKRHHKVLCRALTENWRILFPLSTPVSRCQPLLDDGRWTILIFVSLHSQ